MSAKYEQKMCSSFLRLPLARIVPGQAASPLAFRKRGKTQLNALMRLPLLSSALLVLFLSAVLPAQAADTSLSMSSEPGDYIGGGRNYFFTPGDGPFNAQRNSASGVSLSLFPPGTFWFLDFAGPNTPLTPGSYFDLHRYPFFVPGLEISGDGRGCNMLNGSFQVKQIVYGEGSQIASFWAVFEQHCEGAAPALRGDLRFNADVVVAVTAPLTQSVEKGRNLTFTVTATEINGSTVSLTPANLPAGANFTDNADNTGTFSWTPGFDQGGTFDVTFQGDNGNGGTDSVTTRINVTGITSLLLDSDLGDFVGGGQLLFLTPADGALRASSNFDNGVSGSFSSSTHFFNWDFAAPNQQPLSVGVYDNAARFPFQNHDQPGLDVFGDGRGCNMLTGRFEVKQVEYSASKEVKAFWATFEQHCEGAAPALRGELRFNADLPMLVRAPFRNTVSENGSLNFDVTAFERSGGLVTLTASGLPPGANFTDNGDNTGSFSWTPAPGQSGSYRLSFTGDNGQGGADTAFALITVTPSAHPI